MKKKKKKKKKRKKKKKENVDEKCKNMTRKKGEKT